MPEAEAPLDEYEYGDPNFYDSPLVLKLLGVANAKAKVSRSLKDLETSLSSRSKALKLAADLKAQALRPRNTPALIAAMAAAKNTLSSSQEDKAVREALEQMQISYAKPEDTDTEEEVQGAEKNAETARGAAKQALLDFETAKAEVAKLERELAKMQQSQPEETTVNDTTSEDGGKEWLDRAEQMALMLDRTFLTTGAYDPRKPPLLKKNGAWFCDELKLWFVPPARQEARARCLAIWEEYPLSFRELKTLLGKKFGWSGQ